MRTATPWERTLLTALKVAAQYVYATEASLPIQPNVVTKDADLCRAAIGAAEIVLSAEAK